MMGKGQVLASVVCESRGSSAGMQHGSRETERRGEREGRRQSGKKQTGRHLLSSEKPPHQRRVSSKMGGNSGNFLWDLVVITKCFSS